MKKLESRKIKKVNGGYLCTCWTAYGTKSARVETGGACRSWCCGSQGGRQWQTRTEGSGLGVVHSIERC